VHYKEGLPQTSSTIGAIRLRAAAALLGLALSTAPQLALAQPSDGAAASRRATDGTAVPAFEAIASRAGALPRLHSLLVSQDGRLVLERYFRGTRASKLANIKSASKSVISALVGLAVARGFIKDANQPIAPYFKEELGTGSDPRKQVITIEHLLSMQSGLESTSGRNYGAWVQSGNWVRYAIRQPLIADPGTTMEYSTGSTHLLSALIARATKQSTWQFAERHLATPLGFSLARWPQDPQGVYFGGNDMLLTPRQMVAFGDLYLNRGKVGAAEVLPASWIDRSFVPRGRSRWGSDREYGYGWWMRDLAGERAYYAWGYGGQFIFVIPSTQMVIVTTSDPAVSRERREHLQAIYDLAAEIVSGGERTTSGGSDARREGVKRGGKE
jgi:CubicO group peptidase (beta-lactamase class C family)